MRAVGGHIVQIIAGLFAKYGYWAVVFGLLLENAGVPAPGETILLFASFLAYSRHELYPPYIIAVGIAAATLGDNIGYIIGRRGGRPLLNRYRGVLHVSEATIGRGERLFERYGAKAIFFARFITGVRVIAGPLAGVLHMRWRRFVVFNFLGASAWVTAVVAVGYLFGSQFETLLRVFGWVGIVLMIVAAVVVIGLWLWHRRRAKRRAR